MGAQQRPGQPDLAALVTSLTAWLRQRKYVTGHYKGVFRLSGGAGTGKTVVAVHRALELLRRNPRARILLTTYTRNLADDLSVQLRRLDEDVRPADKLGQSGILVPGIDSLAWAVVQQAGESIAPIAQQVPGAARAGVLAATPYNAWREAVTDADTDLHASIANQAFMEAEYAMIVLPGRITTEQQYIRARRQGRGVALDRTRRIQVWKVIQTYRDTARLSDSTDFGEKALLAATWLRENHTTRFDHVLVDEGQDLSPAHLLLLRALVAEGPDDLFLAEDSHQRIYGNKVTLSKYGINIRGRSRRLTLNYRTTAQNLHWAMRILSGGEYVDLEGDTEKHEYRSSRSGPMPVTRHAATPSEELDNAAMMIRSWLPLDHEVQTLRAPAPETIAVLVRDKYRRDTVVSGLQERGVQVRSVDRENPRPGKPLVMTMHRAKGLEFTHVLLFDVQEGAIPRALKDYDASPEDKADAMLRERSLLYVAATRARDLLAVSWHGKVTPLLG
ncbi:MAG TPA: 3'-5' exonuclease [Dermatophilaceae bacterium]|nr:3'-5' exonuclease [Dermatophilaceae bacterium]